MANVMNIQTVILQFITALTGCLGFSIVFHVRRRQWLAASIGGVVSWAVYLLILRIGGSDYASALAGASAAALYGEIMARREQAPSTIFTVIASIPLVPGASLYRSANNYMIGQAQTGRELGVYTLLFAACMSAGIVVTTLIFRAVSKQIRERKKKR